MDLGCVTLTWSCYGEPQRAHPTPTQGQLHDFAKVGEVVIKCPSDQELAVQASRGRQMLVGMLGLLATLLAVCWYQGGSLFQAPQGRTPIWPLCVLLPVGGLLGWRVLRSARQLEVELGDDRVVVRSWRRGWGPLRLTEAEEVRLDQIQTVMVSGAAGRYHVALERDGSAVTTLLISDDRAIVADLARHLGALCPEARQLDLVTAV